jgi:hypothetical protein
MQIDHPTLSDTENMMSVDNTWCVNVTGPHNSSLSAKEPTGTVNMNFQKAFTDLFSLVKTLKFLESTEHHVPFMKSF